MDPIYDLVFEEDGLYGKNVEEDLEELLNECEKRLKNYDRKLIEKAYYFSYEHHKGIIRASGVPYYTHPLQVAMILLREIHVDDVASVATCLLHDTIEDVDAVDRSLIEKEFSEEISQMVEAVTKIRHSNTSQNEEEEEDKIAKEAEKNAAKAATYRKLFLALVRDVRVIIIKLADRLHNMRTLHYLNQKKRVEIAEETLNFYTPFAQRLGLTKLKQELEDLSLYFSNRTSYEAIRSALIEKRRDFIDYIRVFSEDISENLEREKVDCRLSVDHKHIYEIYRMLKNGKSISDIDNFYSLVIVLNTNDKYECYRAHGVLVNTFSSVERLVDLVARPKISWYQSLNTQLVGPDGKRVEVLIRTREMEKMSRDGVASLVSLKRGRIRALEIDEKDIDEWGEWMEDMIREKSDEATQIIWDSIKVNLFDAEVEVFTHKGETVRLPANSSPVDFAFAISEEVGRRCISVKINGKIKKLNYELQSGDQVYVITTPKTDPKPEWMNYVVSHRAVVKLHRYFKNNPVEKRKPVEKIINFNVKLRIHGEDKPGMLQKITAEIGQTNIKRISLDSSDSYFEGQIILNVRDEDHYNEIFSNITSIAGVKGVDRLDDAL